MMGGATGLCPIPPRLTTINCLVDDHGYRYKYHASDIRYAGREDEVILFETETGLERMTVRQMLDEFEGDAEDFEALKVCVG